jgi:hypothetical protein
MVARNAAFAAMAVAQLACHNGERASSSATTNQSPGQATARVTLGGCLDRGVIPGTFVLRTDQAATGTSGGPEPGGGAGTATEYTIRSLEGRSLDDYVGKRVRLSGHFEPAHASAPGSEPHGTTGTYDHARVPVPAPDMRAARGEATGPARQVNADEIRIEGSCGQAGNAGR